MRPSASARFGCAALVSAFLAVSPSVGAAGRTGAAARSFRVVVTAYCQRGITKSGAHTAEGIAAADPRVVPLGSLVRVEAPPVYTGTYTVMDTGAAIKGRRLDVFVRSCRLARRLGRRAAMVRVLLSR